MEIHVVRVNRSSKTIAPVRRMPKGSEHGTFIIVNGKKIKRSDYDSEDEYREATRVKVKLQAGDRRGPTCDVRGIKSGREINGMGECDSQLPYNQSEDIQAAVS